MKKLTAFIIATVVVLSLFCLPAQAAADPKLDPVNSAVSKIKTMWGLGYNGSGKIRDRSYAADFNAEYYGSKPIVTTQENSDQVTLWSSGSSKATLGTGFVCHSLDARKDIAGTEGTPGSIYCAALMFEIDSGLGETVCGSFCIVMGPDSARWGRKLNGFDVWLGPSLNVDPDDYKLVYHAENLVDFGLWETSADGSYCYIEANFDQPMQAAYAVLALTYDDLATTYEGKIAATEPGQADNPIFTFLMSEFAVFDTTLDGRPAAEGPESGAASGTEASVTEAPETQAPETQAPVTQAPETKAPETQAPTTQEPAAQAPATQAPQTREQGGGDGSAKKGCGGSAALAAVICCSAAGAAFFRRKRRS
jgi:hypothetical protein